MLFGLPKARQWLFKRNVRSTDIADQATLMARVSYELRTSLTGIVGYAEFLENRTVEPMMNFTAKIIRESASNLARSCNAYFDLQHLQRGQLCLSSAPFNLSQLLHDLVELHQQPALERSISVQFVCAPNTLSTSICSDVKRLRQVLDALIFNAIQTAETWDSVNIQLSWHGDMKFLVLLIGSKQMKQDPKKLALAEQFWNSGNYQFELQEGPGVEMALAKSLIQLAGYSAKYSVTQDAMGSLELKLPAE